MRPVAVLVMLCCRFGGNMKRNIPPLTIPRDLNEAFRQHDAATQVYYCDAYGTNTHLAYSGLGDDTFSDDAVWERHNTEAYTTQKTSN